MNINPVRLLLFIWNNIVSALLIQTVAAWHGYDWPFWTVVGYMNLYFVFYTTPQIRFAHSALVLLVSKEYGKSVADKMNAEGAFEDAAIVTIAYLIVRFAL